MSALPERTDGTARDPGDGWSRYGWLLPAVWLVFLGYTVAAVLSAGLGSAGVAAGLALVALFAAVYLAAFVVLGGPMCGRLRFAHWNWVGLGAMVAIILAMSALIGVAATFMAPFVIAYACYLLPRAGAWWVGGATLAGCLAALLASGQTGRYAFMLIILAGVFIVNMTQASLMAADNRNQLMARDLAIVSERERVARDVHDGLGHTLTVVALKAELADRILDIDPARAHAELGELRALLREALGEVRSTVGGLRANDLTTQARALELALRGAGIEVASEGDPGDVDPALQVPLGWVLREAGTNVLRHSRAAHCTLRFGRGALSVEDDGVGVGSSAPGHGRRGMAERVAEAGGSLEVSGLPGGGTRVAVSW